jgi:hypothetical protein
MRHDGPLALRLGRGEFDGPRLDFPAQNDVSSALLVVRSARRSTASRIGGNRLPHLLLSDLAQINNEPRVSLTELGENRYFDDETWTVSVHELA